VESAETRTFSTKRIVWEAVLENMKIFKEKSESRNDDMANVGDL